MSPFLTAAPFLIGELQLGTGSGTTVVIRTCAVQEACVQPYAHVSIVVFVVFSENARLPCSTCPAGASKNERRSSDAVGILPIPRRAQTARSTGHQRPGSCGERAI